MNRLEKMTIRLNKLWVEYKTVKSWRPSSFTKRKAIADKYNKLYNQIEALKAKQTKTSFDPKQFIEGIDKLLT